MTFLSYLFFFFAAIILFYSLAIKHSQKRIKSFPIKDVEIVDCKKRKNHIGMSFYTIKYRFFQNDKEIIFFQDERKPRVVGAIEKMVVIGNDTDTYIVCSLEEGESKKGFWSFLLSVSFLIAGLSIPYMNTILNCFAYLMNVKNTTTNIFLTSAIAMVGLLIVISSIVKKVEFQKTIKKINTFRKNDESKALLKKPKIIECYENGNSEKFILKYKIKKEHIKETFNIKKRVNETLESSVSTNEEKDNNFKIINRLDNSLYSQWLFIGILICITSILII